MPRRRSHVAHGEHPVGDDPGEPSRAGERVVLMQRVLVAADVGVRLDVVARDDAGELGKLLARPRPSPCPSSRPAARSIICDRAVQTTTPSASSRSIAIVRNPFPPLIRIDSMRARTASSSPSRSGRRNVYSCVPCTTREKSRARCRSATICGNAANSAAVTKVGGTPVADPEQRSEGGDTRRVDDERDVRVGRSFGGGVHRAYARVPCSPCCPPAGGRTKWVAEATRKAAHPGLPSGRWPAPDRTATRSRCTIPSPSSSPTITARSARRCRSRSTRSATSASIEVVDRGEDAVPVTTIDQEPDVVLMDLRMPDVDGHRGDPPDPRRGRRRAPSSSSPGEGDDVSLAPCDPGGARGFLQKTAPMADVADADPARLRGEPLHRPAEVNGRSGPCELARSTTTELAAARSSGLTPREIEILQAMAGGPRARRDRGTLGMSRHTLRTHTQNILTKLGVHSKTDAVVAAIRIGKVTPPGLAVPGGTRRGRPSGRPRACRLHAVLLSASRGAACACGTTGSTSSSRAGRGRSPGS